ncbi:acetyl-CoA carboxylase biotin carboxylase subunit [Plantactinospora sp. WMMB334]|uniref:acetyl-CoA carboxylase biotin carboxylase subunit n=1 Tax=Plantactinospora sp. WMMB334 TaxID=3404119 RepID=UPI003B938EA1
MFEKILIANRGEIALRVARACRELGVRTVAVYSVADRDSAVVRLADEAVCIGPPEGRQSYRNAAAIVEAARRTGAEAVHPGYGFLSEDADFAEICAENGLVFIGPRPEVMLALGDKARARALMRDADLPLPPGSLATVGTAARARAVADEIGYPVIIKCAAGGGGRGMTVVWRAEEFGPAYDRTRSAAQAVFGDDRVYVERYLAHARHVEVQVLCDGHGHGVHLGTRDCSVQRRHQKLIEEGPAPGLSTGTLDALAGAALRGALHAGYTGVGTFEFLVDEAEGFSFIEVNCRIQVEHPVTEMITGIDLVHEQLHIAAGVPLRLRQEDVRISGVAVECRVNAEDPDRGFAPAPGRLARFAPPGGPFTRVDTHGYPGYLVGPYYDSLLAKVVVWAPDRDLALGRMRRALHEFDVDGPGVRTTIPFLRRVLDDAGFRRGRYSTGLVDRMLAVADPPAEPSRRPSAVRPAAPVAGKGVPAAPRQGGPAARRGGPVVEGVAAVRRGVPPGTANHPRRTR